MTDLPTTNETATDDATVPRKAQGRGDTRGRLLAAAQELFVTKGFHATRPQDISRAAGVGHGTFYLHFKDKRDCFLAFAETAAEQLEAYVEFGLTEDALPYNSIRYTMKRTYEFSRANPGLMAAALTDMSVIDGSEGGSLLMGRWGVQWAERLAEWQSQGKILPQMDAGYIGYAIPGMMRQAAERAAALEAGEDAPIEALMDFLAVGLGLEKSSSD